jgi:hypothetical protein
MATENSDELIKSKARATRFFSFVVAFIFSIISILEMVDFNKSVITEASVNIPNLISLTTEPSILAYASILILGLCLFFIIKSTNTLNKK